MAASKYKTTIRSRQPMLTDEAHRIFKFKIQLLRAPYPIWRVVLIDENSTLAKLQYHLLLEMGWLFGHFYELQIDNRSFVDLSVYDYSDSFEKHYDGSKYLVKNIFNIGDKCRIIYDFGDFWEHSVVVQDIMIEPYITPFCIKGRGACPPEDCGGVYSFANLLEALKNPDDPEYESALDWLGDQFDPDSFSL